MDANSDRATVMAVGVMERNRKTYKRRVLTSRITAINQRLDNAALNEKEINDMLSDIDTVFQEFEEAEEAFAVIDPEEDDAYSRYVGSYFHIKSELCSRLKIVEGRKVDTPSGSTCEGVSSSRPASPSSQSETENHEKCNQTEESIGARLCLESDSHNPDNSMLAKAPNERSRFRQSSFLPTIDLPKFNGNYSEWPSWHDTFISLIHQCDELSPVEKMHFLKSSLRGEAATILSDLTTTSGNYEIAWQKIRCRYERPQLIIESLIGKFLNLPMHKGSVQQLRKIVDTVDSVTRSLDRLGPVAASRDPWLMYVVKSKLDEETQRQWAQNSFKSTKNSFQELMSFLENRCYALEMYGTRKQENAVSSRAVHHQGLASKRVQAMSVTSATICTHCGGNHPLNNCQDFRKLKTEDRRKKASNNMLCFNCLKPNHQATECRSKFSCFTCKKKHHTLLHLTDQITERDATDEVRTQALSTAISGLRPEEPIARGWLATAIAWAETSIGSLLKCRILIDPGSETSFIAASMVNKLQLLPKFCKVQVAGLQGKRAEVSNASFKIRLKSVYGNESVHVQALKLSKIVDDIPSNGEMLDPRHGLDKKPLADPEFYKPNRIDILIGANEYYDIIRPQSVIKMPNGLRLMNTIFGWIVGGSRESHGITHAHVGGITDLTSIEKQLRAFWESEEVESNDGHVDVLDPCEMQFVKTTQRTECGRYIVRLPFRKYPPNLGKSHPMALSSMYSLEKRFKRQPDFASLYRSYMKSYESNGHMEKVANDDRPADACYITHHGVMKSGKIRVVFNAAAKTSNGQSINDQLLPGPKLQSDLRQILLRGRFHRYIIGTDISQMFCQIRVSVDHTDYLRILWRESVDHPIETFRMTTLPFGLDCSPFLAQRTIQQLVEDDGHKYPKAAEVITLNRYVDDIYHGSNDIDELIVIRDQLIQLLRSGGFELRKWYANDTKIVQDLPDDVCCYAKEKLYQSDSAIKSLGIRWIPKVDMFEFKIELDSQTSRTKRKILSELARTYDPFGWLSPVVVSIKILLQDLWRTSLG